MPLKSATTCTIRANPAKGCNVTCSSERSSRGFSDTVLPSGVLIRRVLKALVQKVSDLFLRGRFLHDSLVHVGYSAFTVNERR